MKNRLKIIFVHLGNELPEYLLRNMEKIAQDFPKNEVILISDSPGGFKFTSKNIYFVKVEVFQQFEEIASNARLDRNFRGGFWIYSILRLLVLVNWIIDNCERQILHIESDMWLSRNLPLDDISRIRKITWGSYNEKRDVASLMYFPDFNSAVWLKDRIETLLRGKNDYTDMSILKRVSQTEPGKVSYFPNGLSLAQNMSTINSLKERKRDLESVVSREIKFEGIFDSASIGMWLAGQDPRNHYGVTHFFSRENIDNGNSYVDPSRLFYVREGSKIFILSNGKKIPLYCLHIHSKNRLLLDKRSEDKEIMKLFDRYESNNWGKKVYREFSLPILLKYITQQIAEGSFWRYLLFSPPFRKLTLRIQKCVKTLILLKSPH